MRAMVDAGLYTEMRNAVRALESSALGFCSVESKTHGNGRPSTDYILALPDAQFFAATARSTWVFRRSPENPWKMSAFDSIKG